MAFICIFTFQCLYVAFASPLFSFSLSIRTSLPPLVTKPLNVIQGALSSGSAPSWKHDLELVTSPFWVSVSPFGNLMSSQGPPKADFLGVCDLPHSFPPLVPPSLEKSWVLELSRILFWFLTGVLSTWGVYSLCACITSEMLSPSRILMTHTP